MRKDIEKIKKQITPILKKYGVRRASLFGSFARGQESADSDMDILVELKGDSTLLDLVRLEKEIAEATGKEVDLLTYDSLHPKIKKYVKKDELQLFQ